MLMLSWFFMFTAMGLLVMVWRDELNDEVNVE